MPIPGAGPSCPVSIFDTSIDLFDPAKIKSALGALEKAFSDQVTEGVELIRTVTTAIANPDELINKAKAGLSKLLDRIILEAENILERLIEEALDFLLEEFNKLMEQLYRFFMNLVNLVNAIIEGALQAVCDVLTGVLKIIEHFVNAIDAAIDTVTGPVFNVIDAVENLNLTKAQDAAKKESDSPEVEDDPQFIKYFSFEDGKLVRKDKKVSTDVNINFISKAKDNIGELKDDNDKNL